MGNDWDASNSTTALITQGTIPEQRPSSSPFAEDAFPSVFIPASPHCEALPLLLKAITTQKDDIELALQRSGAVLFRGFNVLSASDFDAVVGALGYDSFAYRGRGISKKRPVVGRVVTASENPAHVNIGFHNEMAYQSTTPSKIIFYCEVEPPQDARGATPIVQGHVAYKRMMKELPQFVKEVESKGLSYVTLLKDDPSAKEPNSWQFVLNATTKEEAELNAKEGDTHIEWKELDRVALSILGPRVGVKMDKKRGRKVWFNSIDATYVATQAKGHGKHAGVTFGDGTLLSESVMLAHHKILKDEQVAFKWKRGDILILENDAVMHSREASKPPRKILASLCAN